MIAPGSCYAELILSGRESERERKKEREREREERD
jgi:hypothetical protein